MKVSIAGHAAHHRTVAFDKAANNVLLIEQRLLPHSFEIIRTRDFRETAKAIKDMIVRGAGAIGATAAYGFAQGLRDFKGSEADFAAHEAGVFETMKRARPKAVDPVYEMFFF